MSVILTFILNLTTNEVSFVKKSHSSIVMEVMALTIARSTVISLVSLRKDSQKRIKDLIKRWLCCLLFEVAVKWFIAIKASKQFIIKGMRLEQKALPVAPAMGVGVLIEVLRIIVKMNNLPNIHTTRIHNVSLPKGSN